MEAEIARLSERINQLYVVLCYAQAQLRTREFTNNSPLWCRNLSSGSGQHGDLAKIIYESNEDQVVLYCVSLLQQFDSSSSDILPDAPPSTSSAFDRLAQLLQQHQVVLPVRPLTALASTPTTRLRCIGISFFKSNDISFQTAYVCALIRTYRCRGSSLFNLSRYQSNQRVASIVNLKRQPHVRLRCYHSRASTDWMPAIDVPFMLHRSNIDLDALWLIVRVSSATTRADY